MFPTRWILASTVSVILYSVPSYSAPVEVITSASTSKTCSESPTEAKTYGDIISVSRDPCRQSEGYGYSDDQRRFNSPRKTDSQREGPREKSPKPLYKVEYDDPCPIGLERPNGCVQNPDAQLCDDGSRPERRLITFADGPRKGEVVDFDYICPEDSSPLPISDELIIEQEAIVVTPAEFRKFPIKSFSVHSDPDGVSLIRAYTHFWAEGGSQEFHTVMSGKNVDVRAIPVEWLWDYGDGTTARFSDPGGPVDDRSLSEATPTSHQFQDTGLFQVKVTTMYRGEFRVENGSWEPIPGQAAVPSDQSPMDIWRTKKQLVDPNV